MDDDEPQEENKYDNYSNQNQKPPFNDLENIQHSSKQSPKFEEQPDENYELNQFGFKKKIQKPNSPPREESKEPEEPIGSTHPLKYKLLETIGDIRKSTQGKNSLQLLNFVKILMSDPSIQDPEQFFYLKPDEFAEIVDVLANLLKLNEIDPIIIFEIFDIMKSLLLEGEVEATEAMDTKTEILLQVFVSHIKDVTEIGLKDIVANFYKILNSYTIDLKKIEVSKILTKIDYRENELDKTSFKVHFKWFKSQILGQFFFIKDIEPCLPLLIT